MESSNEEMVTLTLTLGEHTITPKVPYRLKRTYEDARNLFSQEYEKVSKQYSSDKSLAIVAFYFAVNYLVERNTKDDKVLAPVMQDLLADIEEALDNLE